MNLGRPEFDDCANCGGRIARMSDRERWHHVNQLVNSRSRQHVPLSSAEYRAAQSSQRRRV